MAPALLLKNGAVFFKRAWELDGECQLHTVLTVKESNPFYKFSVIQNKPVYVQNNVVSTRILIHFKSKSGFDNNFNPVFKLT